VVLQQGGLSHEQLVKLVGVDGLVPVQIYTGEVLARMRHSLEFRLAQEAIGVGIEDAEQARAGARFGRGLIGAGEQEQQQGHGDLGSAIV
jgi:hypothetical protein